MRKLVSIIMPSYNTPSEYLEQAVDSVLSQNYHEFELIIIDDGSTEANWEIEQKYAAKDSRIYLYKNDKNRGIVYTLNRAMGIAKGDYVFRMDSDDVCETNRLSRTIEFLDDNPDIDIVGGQFRYLIGGKLGIWKPHMPRKDEEIKARMLWSSPFAHPTICFRKSSIEKYDIRYLVGEKAEDYNLWVSCAIAGCKFANLNDYVLRYRIHKDQITQTQSNSLSDSNASIRKKLFDYLNITIDSEGWEAFNAYADGLLDTSEKLKSADRILVKVVLQLPESYAQANVAKRVLGDKFFHECLRASLNGVKKAGAVFSYAEMSREVKYRRAKTLLLKTISIIR